MDIGMIGLGRMGANMAERLVRGGHRVAGYDPRAESVQRLKDRGGAGANSLAALTGQLAPPRAVWLMVPSGTPMEALELERPIPVISLALDRRFRSRQENPFSDRLLAALREQFGGHPVKHL